MCDPRQDVLTGGGACGGGAAAAWDLIVTNSFFLDCYGRCSCSHINDVLKGIFFFFFLFSAVDLFSLFSRSFLFFLLFSFMSEYVFFPPYQYVGCSFFHMMYAWLIVRCRMFYYDFNFFCEFFFTLVTSDWNGGCLFARYSLKIIGSEFNRSGVNGT